MPHPAADAHRAAAAAHRAAEKAWRNADTASDEATTPEGWADLDATIAVAVAATSLARKASKAAQGEHPDKASRTAARQATDPEGRSDTAADDHAAAAKAHEEAARNAE